MKFQSLDEIKFKFLNSSEGEVRSLRHSYFQSKFVTIIHTDGTFPLI